MSLTEQVVRQALLAKAASRALAVLAPDQKTNLLKSMADALEQASSDILFHNEIDVEAARESDLSPAMVDRLVLTARSIQAMADGVRDIAQQADPVGETLETWSRPSGLRIEKIRVPLGVIGMIYESRPNVTVDAAALCLKAGNAVILRGGSEAINSNRALAAVLTKAAASQGLPEGAVQLLEDTSRDSIMELIHLPQVVDLIIARGSEEMINQVVKNSTVPVLGHGKGVCHVYVDDKADLAMAEKIAFNAKVQRPGVCNAMETLLVNKNVAAEDRPGLSGRQSGNSRRRRHANARSHGPAGHGRGLAYGILRPCRFGTGGGFGRSGDRAYQPLWLRPFRHDCDGGQSACGTFLEGGGFGGGFS